MRVKLLLFILLFACDDDNQDEINYSSEILPESFIGDWVYTKKIDSSRNGYNETQMGFIMSFDVDTSLEYNPIIISGEHFDSRPAEGIGSWRLNDGLDSITLTYGLILHDTINDSKFSDLEIIVDEIKDFNGYGFTLFSGWFFLDSTYSYSSHHFKRKGYE